MKKIILAKPSGITLPEHVAHVMEQAEELLNTFPMTVLKYAQLSEKLNFRQLLLEAVRYHDDGKKHKKWQNACWEDYSAYQSWRQNNTEGSFKDFEHQTNGIAGQALRKAGVRHEIASLVLHKDNDLNMVVKVAIAAHHAKLSTRYETRWKEDLGEQGFKIWEDIKRYSKPSLLKANYNQFEVFLLRYPSFAGVRAWLIAADQRASIAEGNPEIPLPELKKFQYNFPHKSIRNVQRIVSENWRDDLLLIRAPTGAGKTDSSLLWAQKQIDNERAERLVIAMPTRFTSNALSINIAESLSDTGLYHSSAWFVKFQSRIETREIIAQQARNEHEFARRLLTSVTVCTIDHLLMALTLTREDHHQILFNLMNSCLVIDEADFYDEFIQANILVLLKALYHWKVPVLIMSASLPESAKDFYELSGFKTTGIKEDVSDIDRPRCKIISITKMESISDLEEVLCTMLDIGTGIIYANTVNRAQEYYDWFINKGGHPIMYHSRFLEQDKKMKEEELIQCLGRKAWAENTASGIAILTQIGEMSVNISADMMISDICPIDRLVQRAGRLCRFDKNKIGNLHIVIPMKNELLYPAPYGNFTISGWIPNREILETCNLIKLEETYSASMFVSMINTIYPCMINFSDKSKSNADILKSLFVSNWIITSSESSKVDDDRTVDWKSRNIEKTIDVFLNCPINNRFYSWTDFQNFKNMNAITLSKYLVDSGINKYHTLSLKKIIVDDIEKEIIVVINPHLSYTYEQGLIISKELDQYL